MFSKQCLYYKSNKMSVVFISFYKRFLFGQRLHCEITATTKWFGAIQFDEKFLSNKSSQISNIHLIQMQVLLS